MFLTYLDVAHALGLEHAPKSPHGDSPYRTRGGGEPTLSIFGVLDGCPVRLVRGTAPTSFGPQRPSRWKR